VKFKHTISILSKKIKHHAKSLSSAWCLFILVACFLPGNNVAKMLLPLSDRWIHFLLFAILVFLLLHIPQTLKWRTTVAIILCASLFGWGIEMLQGQLTFLGRSHDAIDTLADAIGAALGYPFFYFWQKWTSLT